MPTEEYAALDRDWLIAWLMITVPIVVFAVAGILLASDLSVALRIFIAIVGGLSVFAGVSLMIYLMRRAWPA